MADSKAKKLSREVAEQEVNAWLDFKKVRDRKRESSEDSIESLVYGFMDGDLVMDSESKEITLKLQFPIGGSINELKFKPRLRLNDVHSHLKNVKSSDVDGRILAYVCALTGQNSGIISNMDSEDYSIAQSLAVFFF